MEVVVNGSFKGQEITGQQRYAHEITHALLELSKNYPIHVSVLETKKSNHRLISWVRALFLASSQPKDSWLLTLTSRGPLIAKRHVVVVHDLFVFTQKQWFSKSYGISHRFVLKLQLRHAKIVICVSEPVARELRLAGLTRAKIVVAPNAPAECFTSSHFSREDETRLLDQAGLERMNFFLAVGAVDPRKNIPLLIHAHKTLPKDIREITPLVLVGKKTDLFAKSELNTDKHIIWLTEVSDRDLSILYSNCLAFVMPSLAEGFGLPIVEALASGAEVIANDIEIFHWVAGENATFVDCNSSPEDLYIEMLDRCNSKKNLRGKIVQPNFSWAQSAKNIAETIYEANNENQSQ